MKIRFSVFLGVFAALVCAASFASAAAEVTIDSPRKLVRGTVTVNDTLSLGLTFRGKTVLTDSPLGLTFEDGAYGPLSVLRTETRQINNTWENRFGRVRVVRDRATEVTIYCQERSAPNRKFTVVLRAYDDGFAFRYVVPGGEEEHYVLAEEKTCFRFGSDLTCWASDNGHLDSSHEAPFGKTTLSALRPEGVYALPLVAAGDFGCAALAEAQVTN